MANRLQPGDLIGAYRVTKAMHDGYRAEHRTDARSVFIKVDLGDDALHKIARAIQVRDALEHPGVAHIVESGVVDGEAWMASAMPAGVVLYDVVAVRLLQAGEVESLIHDVAEILAHAHARGVVHGNLRLHNLILGDGAVPVSISEWDDATGDAARASTAFSAYAAPEVRAGGTDARSDIYALGVIAYRALLGRFPSAVTTNVPGVSPGLAALMVQMLDADPAVRPSAREVEVTLDAMDHGPSIDAELVDDRDAARLPPVEAVQLRRFKQPRWTPPTHLARPAELTPPTPPVAPARRGDLD